MVKTGLLTLVLLVWSAPLCGQEAILLTKPLQPPIRTGYQPMRLTIDVFPQPRIEVIIQSNDGVNERFAYPCNLGECDTDTDAEVAAMIDGLNSKVNMVTRSLWRRVMDRLCADFPSRFPGGCTVQ